MTLTKGIFTDALSLIDERFITEVISFTEKHKQTRNKIRKALLFKVLPTAATVAILAAVLIVGIGKRRDASVTPGASDAPLLGELICSGSIEVSGKPTTSQRISASCLSYYTFGEKITIDAEMCDDYSYYQKYRNNYPCYDLYGKNGYPYFIVADHPNIFSSFLISDGSASNSKLIINGASGDYKKIFSYSEMFSLDRLTENSSGLFDQKSELHKETVEIDFSALKPGDYGTITLEFGWYFDHDNPYHTSDEYEYSPAAGYRRFLGYYVGEKGIGLSFNGAEDAKYNLEKVEGVNEHEEKIAMQRTTLCSAKPFYLSSSVDKTQIYKHGNIVTANFFIVETSKNNFYHIKILSDKNIELLSPTDMDLEQQQSNSFKIQFKLKDQCFTGELQILVDAIDCDGNISASHKSTLYFLHNGDLDYISLNGYEDLAEYSNEL